MYVPSVISLCLELEISNGRFDEKACQSNDDANLAITISFIDYERRESNQVNNLCLQNGFSIKWRITRGMSFGHTFIVHAASRVQRHRKSTALDPNKDGNICTIVLLRTFTKTSLFRSAQSDCSM